MSGESKRIMKLLEMTQSSHNEITMQDLKMAAQHTKPYLEHSGAASNPRQLYRGFNTNSRRVNPNSLSFVATRFDREPLSTLPSVHRAFDSAFKRAFHYPYRSASAFATLDKSQAAHYGDIFEVVPAGNNYQFCFSPQMIDLYADVDTFVYEGKGNFPGFVQFARGEPDVDQEALDDHDNHMIDINFIVQEFPQEFQRWCDYLVNSIYQETTQTSKLDPHAEVMIACEGVIAVPLRKQYAQEVHDQFGDIFELDPIESIVPLLNLVANS